MLQPRKRKFRKDKKGRNKGIAQSGASVSFGELGLKSVSRGRITAKQIEAARRSITHHLKRGGKVLIRVFPDKPVTKKPAEVRMGNGKGSPDHYVFVAQPGKVLYEVSGTEPLAARKALMLAAAKLSLKTKIVCRS